MFCWTYPAPTGHGHDPPGPGHPDNRDHQGDQEDPATQDPHDHLIPQCGTHEEDDADDEAGHGVGHHAGDLVGLARVEGGQEGVDPTEDEGAQRHPEEPGETVVGALSAAPTADAARLLPP